MGKVKREFVAVTLEKPVGTNRKFLALVVKGTVKFIGFLHIGITGGQFERRRETLK